MDAENYDENKAKRVANLKPVKPGECRNPRGNHTRTPHLATRLKALLRQRVGDRTAADLMLDGGIHAARKGNAAWAKLIFDRIDGALPTALDVTSKGEAISTPTIIEVRIGQEGGERANGLGDSTTDE